MSTRPIQYPKIRPDWMIVGLVGPRIVVWLAAKLGVKATIKGWE
jgi:hypothetical protein